MLEYVWTYWNIEDVGMYDGMIYIQHLNILMNQSTFQHFREMPWISIILARTLDILNLWDVQRYAAICSDTQRYAAICSGIITIPGVLDKLMEIYDISLKW